MDTDTVACQYLLRESVQVATFVHALQRVAGDYPWREVEPYAREAWEQLSDDKGGPMWVEVRDFVHETWDW